MLLPSGAARWWAMRRDKAANDNDYYLHCTGTPIESGWCYQVAYLSGRIGNYGQWVVDSKKYKTSDAAAKVAKKISKTIALNGRVSVRLMPRSQSEADLLNANLDKF